MMYLKYETSRNLSFGQNPIALPVEVEIFYNTLSQLASIGCHIVTHVSEIGNMMYEDGILKLSGQLNSLCFIDLFHLPCYE